MDTLITMEKFDGASSIIEFFEPAYFVNIDRAYRNQAMALIGICQFFSRFSAEGQEQHTEFKMVLRTCDDVLRFAVYSGQKTTHKTNKWFESAIQTLSAYASMFHPGIDLVRTRMGVAKSRDIVLYNDLDPPDLIVVNFSLLKTLPDPWPVVVQLMLSPTARIEEVLWHFAHFEDNRRISLHDNPRFYSELPTSSDAYTRQFKAHPIENLVLRPNATLYVLVDQSRRVFLETRRETRILSSVFMLKDVMIFKDAHGVLEGESVVGESILDVPHLWRNEKFFVIPDSRTSTLAYDLRLHPIITANTTAKRTSRDRRNLLRGALGSTSSNDLCVYAGQLPPLWTPRKNDLLPSVPISERPEWCDLLYTTFDALNGNILLTIFNFCRLDDEGSWNLKLRWCKLSHVCRKWWHVIHRSSLHLAMHIPFTNGAPPLDMLSHSPALPMVIDFRSRDAAEIDGGVLHAMLQRGHICPPVLPAPSASSEDLIVPIDGPFPTLECLSLSSTLRLKEDTKLMIPRMFLALNLRRLTSHGTLVPKRISMPVSSVSLVILKLTDIRASGYSTPEELVTQLQQTPQLEELSIDFSTPMSRLNAEGELLRPPTPLTTLPTLKRLVFRGIGAYLEGLLAQINAPPLEWFDITLSNRLTFSLQHLSHLTKTTATPRHPVANVIFDRKGVSFVVGPRTNFSDGSFSLKVRCRQFDGQIIAATQICGALEPVLSAIEEVTFELDTLPPDRQNGVDGKAWPELLGLFHSAKQLRIVCPQAPEISSVLESYRAGVTPGQLPASQDPHADAESGHESAFPTFIDARPPSVRPVQLHLARSQHSQSTESSVVIEADSIPVVGSRPRPGEEELVPPAKKNWFRRTVVDRVWRRVGSYVCTHG